MVGKDLLYCKESVAPNENLVYGNWGASGLTNWCNDVRALLFKEKPSLHLGQTLVCVTLLCNLIQGHVLWTVTQSQQRFKHWLGESQPESVRRASCVSLASLLLATVCCLSAHWYRSQTQAFSSTLHVNLTGLPDLYYSSIILPGALRMVPCFS